MPGLDGQGGPSLREGSPGVMRRISDCLLSVRSDCDRKLDGLSVGFLVIRGTRSDIPGLGAVKVFDYAHIHRFLFVVANFDLERFCRRTLALVHQIVGADAFPGKVDSVPV